MNATPLTAAARDAYLLFQSELGTDEVILPAPFRRAERPATERSATADVSVPASTVSSAAVDAGPAEPRTTRPAARTDRGGPSGAVESLAEIAARLAVESRSAMPARAAARVAPSPSPTPSWQTTLQPQLDALRDLDAYWEFVDRSLPEWFSGVAGPAVRADGHPAPRLAVVEYQPDGGALFGGEAGVLLDKMMRAIGLTRDDLYRTALLKTPPPGRAWARKDAARMVPVLLRELRLAGCQQVLLLGSALAEAVLKKPGAPEALCGTAVTVEGLSVSVTWHPAEIAADPAPTAAAVAEGAPRTARPRAAKAWEHLQWLRGLLPARGS